MNPHKDHPATPMAMFSSLWRNRQLILQLARRDIASRYRGSVVGLAWSFINPILMLLVYTFVFSIVFKSRWSTDPNESRTDFAIILFAGMIVFNLFSEVVNRAPGLVTSNANYVKKVVFPLEILPWVSLGSALFHTAISLFVLILAQLIINLSLPWTGIFLPLTLLPLIFASVGFAWFLSAIGVFVRDIGQITGLFTTILLFMSAVFYPISALPEQYQSLLQLNPLVLIISESRKSLVLGELPDWFSMLIALLVSLAIAFSGFWWFQKVRKGFADVI
jgi:lipopolysaccharide transport system permease protein